MSIDIAEFYQTFFDEADELLDEMERLLIALDPAAPDGEQLNAIFRAAHSIKGGAGTFGFTCLQDTTHRLENLLDRARHGELVLDRSSVDVFLACRDVLKGQIDAYRAQREPDNAAFEHIVARLDALAVAPTGEAASPDAEPIASAGAAADTTSSGVHAITISGLTHDQCPALVEELGLFGDIRCERFADDALYVELVSEVGTDDIEAVLCFVVDAEQIRFGAVVPQAPAAPAEPVPAAPEAVRPAVEPAPAPSRGASEASSLRVSTEKVDEIINLVGELVITQSMLEQTMAGLDPTVYGALLEGLGQLQRNARDLQEAVMSVRMMPMAYAFDRFPRLVRDLGSKLGKDVELVTRGASTELDKGLIERILDPMTHLVRNSLDHGIEAPAQRQAAGKPATGTLTLAAQHQGGNILIEISDDGAGLDRERILAKARANGLPVADNVSDDEVWQLIFAPGFSTAEAVTDVSGRGVGMDVVKRNIQELGGHVDIRSQAGQGTTICIVLPLTLAIMDGMLLRVGGEVFIMPLGAIMESMQARPEQIRQLAGGHRLVQVRGEYLPLIEMHRVFDIEGAETDVHRGIVMIVQSEGRLFALLVDELLGQRQVVVKNLETNYRKVVGISAATILGDGSVALILDVVALSRAGRAAPQPAVPAAVLS